MQNNAATGKRAYFPYLNRVLNELGVYVWCALSSCIKHIFNTKGIVHVAVFIRLTHCKCAFTVCVCVSQFQMTRWKDVTLHIMRGNVAPLQQKPTNFRHCALFDFGGRWWWVSWEHFTDISKTSVSTDYRNHRFIIMLVRYTHKNGTTKKNLGIFIYAEANEIAIHIFTRHRHY